MGVVGFMVIVEGAGQLVLIVRLPDPGGQKSIGVPVRRVGVDGAAVVFGFLAVTAAIDQNPAQELIAAGDGHPVVPAAIRRVVTAAVAEGAGLARAQVIIRRFRAEGDIPPDSAVGRFRRGGAGLDIHAAVHIRVDIIAADAEGVEPGAADVAAAGGVGLRDTVYVDADAVALHTANVVAGVTSAVEAAFAVAGAAAGPGGADERLIAHDRAKIVSAFILQLPGADAVFATGFLHRRGGGDGHLFRGVIHRLAANGGSICCDGRSLINCCKQRGHQQAFFTPCC